MATEASSAAAPSPADAPRPGDVRERLLDSAYAAVVAGGWSRMRMADIAAGAGVSRQTLYNEFGTKEGLLQAVVIREADRFLDRTEAIVSGHPGDAAEAVREAALWTLRASAENPLVRAVITGEEELLPVLTTRSRPLHLALQERMNAYLRRHHPRLGERGEVLVEVSVRLMVSYVLAPTDPERAASRVEAVARALTGPVRENV
ncbi:TetR/AcrR family transcriptional regulator [Nocardiopsis baichengensis]|uniref:TetR/AcrR family transcriptional regulator n=1 Tax=Nocardiopsis baichengensis TaxID=280240 RepID=UPI00034C2275|nr:TetR family transcriptional regulator [Nocardiopsis baichengensis]